MQNTIIFICPPPLDRDATLDTGSGIGDHNVTVRSTTRRTQLPLPRTPPTTPGGVPEWRSSGPVSTPESPPPPPQTASPTPARHEQPRVEPREDLCLCYETFTPGGSSPHLPPPTSFALLYCPLHQSGDRPTLPGMQSRRNSRTSRQKSTPTAQRRGYGRGDGNRSTRDAGWGRRRVIHQGHKRREGRESDMQRLPRFGGG